MAKEVEASAQWKTIELVSPDKNASFAEESLRPGQVVKLALGQNLKGVQISIHFKGTAGKKSKVQPGEWQKRLCAVLPNVCLGATSDVDSQLLISQLANGISILTFRVDEDKERVRKVLDDTDIQFSIDIKAPDGQITRKHYGLDVKPCRKRRWSPWYYYSIPKEWLLPNYNQHSCCGCYSGCGPVAWAQIFAYYDR